MRLSSSTLDAPTARQLLACFNADGALEPVQKLLNRLSDRELEPLLEIANRHLLSDSQVLYQVDRTYQDLAARGLLDPALAQFGRLLENGEFIAASLAVMKDLYSSPQRQDLLVAMETLSKKLTPSDAASAIDLGLTLGETRAFGELQSRMKGASPGKRSLSEVMGGLHAYLREGDIQSGKALLRALAEYPVLEAVDQVVGQSTDQLRVGIPRATSFLKVALAENGRLFEGLTSHFHTFHRRPISCLGGAKQVPDGAMFVIGEIVNDPAQDASRYIQEKGLLTLTAMNPFCSYPPELALQYPVLLELADTNAMQPAADLMKSLYSLEDGKGGRPAMEALLGLLSDASLRHLTPLLSELNDRGAWDDLVILASMPRAEDRKALREGIAQLIRPLPELRGASLYDVFSNALKSAQPRRLIDLAYSLRHFVRSEEPILVPALRVLRSAYYVNDAHPLIELARRMGTEATRNGELFETLFKMSEMPEFRETLKLLSAMSRDGRIRELTGAVLNLFHRFAMEGRSDVLAGQEPAFVPRRRHDLVTADLKPFPWVVKKPLEGDPCRALDLGFRLSDTQRPGFDRQLQNLLRCLNRDGRHGDWERAVHFLRATRPNESYGDRRDLFTIQVDFLRTLELETEQMGYLVDRWMTAYDDGKLERLLQAAPMWVTRDVGGGSVLEPLLSVVRPIAEKALAPLRRLEDFGAKLLRRDDIPSQLGYLSSFLKKLPELPVDPVERADPQGYPPQSYPMEKIASFVKAVECKGEPEATARAQDIVEEYRHAVTGQDRPGGVPHFEWGWEDLREEIEPVLERMTDPDSRKPESKVYDVMLGYMRYFTLEPGERPSRGKHYAPDHLLKWLHERSVDYQMITYYYPGEWTPRVRLVNGLDRLDLVLSNADFVAPVLRKNFGLMFLSEISDAWGDEPWELWPEEIRAKFPNGKARTLDEVVDEIEATQAKFTSMVGYPALPDCVSAPELPRRRGWVPRTGAFKPRMYNLNQLLPVLRENSRNGGLKVLRDLFYELRYSSDPQFQNARGDLNHLSLVLRMIRVGVFRQLGRNLMLYRTEDPEYGTLQEVFRGLVRGSIAPEMSRLAGALLNGDPEHKRVWSLSRGIFEGLGPLGPGPAFGRGDRGRYFRQSGFYLLANGESLGVIPPFLNALAAAVESHGEFLSRRGELVGALLGSPSLSRSARALYEDADREAKGRLAGMMRDAMSDPQRAVDLIALVRAVDEDPAARKAWEQFTARAKSLLESEDYRKLGLSELAWDALDFLSEKSSDPRGVQAARRLRVWTAERLEARDWDALLLAAQKNPTEFHELLKALSHSIENGEVRSILDLARRSLR